MNGNKKEGRNGKNFAALTLAMTLVACGGDDAPPEPVSPCFSNPLVLMACILTPSGTADPVDSPVSGKATSSSPSVFEPVGVDGDVATIATVEEYEPNDSFDNANIVSFAASGSGSASGVGISGDFAGDDVADAFIFTPLKSGLHSIYICAENCASAAESDRLSLILLDQYQNSVAATTVLGGDNLEIAAELVAGMAYYVQVRADAPAVEATGYRLVVVD